MIDIKLLRENPELVKDSTKKKGYEVDIDLALELDARKRKLQQQADELRAKRNDISAKMKGGKPEPELIKEGKSVKEKLAALEADLTLTDEEFFKLFKQIPNIAAADVPVGASEDDNIVVRTIGEPTKFTFTPKNHAQIAEAKDWIDKKRAAKVTGARFAYIKGDLVKLQFAIINFVIDTLTSEEALKRIADSAGIKEASNEDILMGKDDAFKIKNASFTPALPPLMLRTEMYDAMDRLEPSDDRYKIEGEELWLQGSAEHVLGSMYAEERFNYHELPKRYIGFATSFRKEAGTYGKDMEGIIRMHQFDKLEMESLTTEGASLEEHKFLIAIQEYLLQQVGLPYHVLEKCTVDIGKPNARGVDMEVWFPSQEKYRETHTADYMTDYQARRLKTTYRPSVPADGAMYDTKPLKLVHTNDATAFALGRIMAAIIENNQTEDGDVVIPEVLRPYLGDREVL